MISRGCAVWLCAASISSAQVEQVPRPHHSGPDSGAAKSTAHPAPTHSTATTKHLATSKGQKSAKQPSIPEAVTRPATVNLSNGKLTVDADNSDLSQILQDLATLSGMTITGLTKGPRVFGIYGPGNSREILTDLLFASGYNFIMVGGATDGPPRELVLTSRNNKAQALVHHDPLLAPSGESDEAEQPEVTTESPGPAAVDPSLPTELGPGALVPIPSQDSEDDNTRVQRTVERLQHMQDQQQKTAPQ